MIEQAVFANQEGLRLVASSVDDAAIHGKWERKVERFTRLLSLAGHRPPPFALSYFVMGADEVAVLYRWLQEGDSPGRNSSRVLVGSPRVLTVSRALGLVSWPGWRQYDPNQRLGPLDPGGLVDVAESGVVQLREEARQYEGFLRQVVAQLIDYPGRKLNILGCSPEVAAAVTLAVGEIADPYLRERFSVRREWTFSTHEVSCGSGYPEIVFSPVRPDGQDPERRIVIDPHAEDSASAPARSEAEWLIQRFVQGDRSELSVPSASAPPQASGDHAGYGSAPRPGDQPPQPTNPEYALQQATHEAQGRQPVGTAPPGHGPVPDQWQPPHQGKVPAGRPSLGLSRGSSSPQHGNGRSEDPLRKLLESTSAEGADWALHSLAGSYGDKHGRATLRDLVPASRLNEAVSVINHLSHLGRRGPDQLARNYDVLLDLFFGPRMEDLPGAIGYEERYVSSGPVPVFRDRLLLKTADCSPESYALLAPVMADQLAIERGLPAFGQPAPAAVPSSRGGWRQLGWLQLVIAAGVGITLFAVGYLLGGWDESTQQPPPPPAAAGAGTVSTPSSQPDGAAGSGSGSGESTNTKLPSIEVSVAPLVPERSTVDLLVESTDGTLQYSGECRPKDSKSWSCVNPVTPPSVRDQGPRPIVIVASPDAQQRSLLFTSKMTRDQLADQKLSIVAVVGG